MQGARAAALREQIVRDARVLREEPLYHVPCRAFYEERILKFKEELMKLTTEVEATVDVELAPELLVQLEQTLRLYAIAKADLDAAQEDVDAAKAELDRLREKSGARSVGLEGFGRV